MKNTKKIDGTGRFLSLLLALCMILTFIPTVAFADGESVEVIFDSENISDNVVTFNVDETNVSLTVKGADIQTIVSEEGTQYKVDIAKNALSGVTFTVGEGFNSETMQVIVQCPGYRRILNVNDEKVATLAGLDNLPDSVHFGIAKIQQGSGNQNTNVDVQFDNATISGNNEVTFNVNNKAVTLTVDGATVSEDRKVTVDRNKLDAVTFTVGNSFDAETMQITVRGADNYNNALSVNNKVASLNGLNFPGDWLRLEIEAKSGGNEGGGKQNSNVEVQFDNATISGNVVTFNVDNKAVTLTVDGATVSEDRKVTVDRNKLDAVTFTVGNSFNAETMQITVRGADNYNNVLSVNNKVASLNGLNFPGDWLRLEIEAKGGGDNPPPGPGPGGDPAGGRDNIDLEISFTGTFMNAWINNKNVDDIKKVEEDGAKFTTFKGTINGAGTNDVNETNVLRFQEDFGFKPVTEFVINGDTYKEGMEAVKFVKDQGYFITVPGASKYTVTGAAAQDATVDRTIIWANVGANEDAPDYAEDMLLKHGSAKIIAVYAEDGRLVDKEEYLGRDSDEYGVSKDGLGWAKIVPGSKVVFEFVPEYGYQLTSVKSNGFPLEPQKTINQYTFTMPDANVHFAAEFTKTADELKADSKKVASGSISLGNKLEGGSAQLTVSDATLASDKIAGFENAAGEYTISDYLDIDLYNIFYKGKDDADDVWSNKIDELDEYATITIKLEDGVNADDIVIVHNLHDGDKYEIINIDSYDPATNTITFKTKSFSAYAIATKGLVKVTKDEITNAIKDANNASKAEVLISVPKDQDVSYIELPVASVKEVANGKKGLTIETKTATVTLDSKALETIAGKADGENITLNLVKIAKDDLNEKQQKAIKGINVDTILSAEILCGDKVISKDFGGGKATVKLPYTAAEGKKLSDYTIVYIADDGKMLRIPTKVVDGNLVFEIEHFSEYAVALSSEVANVPLSGETPKTGDTTNMLPWLGLMAIAGAGAVVFKRKED